MLALRTAFALIAVLAIADLFARPFDYASVSGGGIPTKQLGRLSPQAPSLPDDLRAAPEYRSFFLAFQKAFPDDFLKFVRSIQAGPDRSAGRNPDAEISIALADLRKMGGTLAAQAGPPALDALFLAQARVLTELARIDPRLCVEFLYGVSSPAFLSFSSHRRDLIAGAANATLSAIVDGRVRRIERPRPSVGQLRLVETAMQARGTEKAEIAALLDGRTPTGPLPDSRLCEAGLAYLEVLRGLPEEVRIRIYARVMALMARS